MYPPEPVEIIHSNRLLQLEHATRMLEHGQKLKVPATLQEISDMAKELRERREFPCYCGGRD